MTIIFAKDRKPNPYTSRAGNTTFVYYVEGTPEELVAYKASKGENFREDTTNKKPLFFTTNAFGATATLVKTTKGEFVPDLTKERTFASLEKQFGTTQAQTMASEMAQ